MPEEPRNQDDERRAQASASDEHVGAPDSHPERVSDERTTEASVAGGSADFVADDTPETPVEVPVRRPVDRRGLALVGARALTGVVAVAAAAGLIAGASLLPLPSLRTTPPSVAVVPDATEERLACPGPLVELTDAGDEGAAVRAFGSADPIADATGDLEQTGLMADDISGAAPVALTAQPSEDEPGLPSLVAGAQSQSAATADVRGFAATACGVPSGDSWLVGGATTTGRTTFIGLTNPTAVAANVTLTLYGEQGPVTAPGTAGISVPAGGQIVLPLAGFAPDLVSPVVHVQSRGGQVVATLQQTIVRGLEAGGVDLVGATAAPAASLTVPGVAVTGSAALAGRIGEAGFEDLQTVLRLFVADDADVTARVSVVPDDGSTTGASFDLPLEAGRVTDLPLDNLTDGSYTVHVEADAPIVGAVRLSQVGATGAVDVGWLPAAPPLSDDALVTIARGGSPTLYLANRTDDAVTAEVSGQAVEVPAGSSARVPVAAGSTVPLAGVEGLYAAVTITGDGAIASYPVLPRSASADPVRVYP
ncbi:DUF5719 family protein [Diaminobutyricimonas aerilata]|uniref:DUF5719 family protein n=1 Tax=Diaminobutyricimonas aerilata TaxID=1162967 RepID=UPI0012FD41CE|nr:DUF5719 family protein [Diaminobutyricimonas aerilata]